MGLALEGDGLGTEGAIEGERKDADIDVEVIVMSRIRAD
jgi:hypothetical protein